MVLVEISEKKTNLGIWTAFLES